MQDRGSEHRLPPPHTATTHSIFDTSSPSSAALTFATPSSLLHASHLDLQAKAAIVTSNPPSNAAMDSLAIAAEDSHLCLTRVIFSHACRCVHGATDDSVTPREIYCAPSGFQHPQDPQPAPALHSFFAAQSLCCTVSKPMLAEDVC